MPLFTRENARDMGLKGAQVRLARIRARKAAFGTSNGAPVAAPSAESGGDFVSALHSRIKSQIWEILSLIDAEAAKRNADGQRLDRLAAALERLADLERVLDGRPLPGSRRPPRDDSSRQAMHTRPAFTHLGPARPVPAPVALVTRDAPEEAEAPKLTLTERPDDWE